MVGYLHAWKSNLHISNTGNNLCLSNLSFFIIYFGMDNLIAFSEWIIENRKKEGI